MKPAGRKLGIPGPDVLQEHLFRRLVKMNPDARPDPIAGATMVYCLVDGH
jgi:hypothetical protein